MWHSLNLKKIKIKKHYPKPTVFTRKERLLLYKDPLKILLQGKQVKYSTAIIVLNRRTFTIKSSLEYSWSCKRLQNAPPGKHSLSFYVRVFIYISANQNLRIQS